MVKPESAVVLPRGEQEFEVESQGAVEWSLEPALGRIVKVARHPGKAVYKAPLFHWSSMDVKLTAKVKDDEHAGGEAIITLSATPNWLLALSIVYVAMFGLAIGLLFWVWPPPPAPIAVEVFPPAVTLSPGKALQFEATISGVPGQAVTWTSSAGSITPAGLFTAPTDLKTDATVTITATRAADGKQSAVAQVTGAPEQLVMTRSVVPAAHMAAGSNLKLEARGNGEKPVAGLTWMTTEGVIDARSGVLTVPAQSASGRAVVTALDPEKPMRKASAVVILNGGSVNASRAEDRNVAGMWIAFLMGGLGALLGALRSLVGFVGNRKFVSSWGIFYLSRPIFGAGLALLVHFGYRMGAFNQAVDSNPMDPANAAFIGGIVGLFADDVLGKLKDFVDRFLQMSEPRMDKMKHEDATAAAPPAPIIKAVVASLASGKVVVTGQNFTAASKLHLNGTAQATTVVSATELSAVLDPAKQVGDELKVVVVNSATSKSEEKTVRVVA
ncbi:Ig-like domain-containing protein [Paludibaculum fermentans]|uniref:Ig-like domain-containing protein n=1 Tax=Paludibaculum fermentans TaxID=1473598 RepID=UPI003EB86CCB